WNDPAGAEARRSTGGERYRPWGLSALAPASLAALLGRPGLDLDDIHRAEPLPAMLADDPQARRQRVAHRLPVSRQDGLDDERGGLVPIAGEPGVGDDQEQAVPFGLVHGLAQQRPGRPDTAVTSDQGARPRLSARG